MTYSFLVPYTFAPCIYLGAAAVAEGVVEAVDEAAGIKDIQNQEKIAVKEAHIDAK